MQRPTSVLISLAEPCMLLKTAFREYTAKLIHTNNPKVVLFQKALDYDFVPYMEQLLKETFGEAGCGVGAELPSTQLLQRDGLDRQTAEYLANQVFRATLSAVCSILPDIPMGGKSGYQLNIVEPMDLFVTLPQPVEVEEYEEY